MKSLDELLYCKELVSIDFSNNKIDDVSGLKNCIKLKKVIGKRNKFRIQDLHKTCDTLHYIDVWWYIAI